MPEFRALTMTEEAKEGLKLWLENQHAVFPIEAESNSSLLACYSIFCEVGGPNDELARFIFDDENDRMVNADELKAELGLFEDQYAVAISSLNSRRISIRVPRLRELVLCRGFDIIISSIIILAKIKGEGLTPVIVRDWLKRTIFSDFNPHAMSYRDQLWVLKNNEVMLYAQLVSQQMVIFQELHDITAHIAGIQRGGFQFAAEVAEEIQDKLKGYFGASGKGNLPSHLIPFLIGVILDGLTQSTIYGSESRRLTIKELLKAIDEVGISPHEKLRLNGFPRKIDAINGLFLKNSTFSVDILKSEIAEFILECRSLTADFSPNRYPDVISTAKRV